MRIIDLAILDAPASLSLLGAAPGGPDSLFSQDAIDRAIARAASQLGDGHVAVVAHVNSNREVTASTVIRVGDHVRVEAAVLWDGHGFKAEDLTFAGQIVARW